MALEIIPSIDLRSGRVVRLQQGDYGRQLTYDVDPIETARRFAAASASWVHVVDLDGAKEGRPAQLQLIGQIVRATQMKVEAGGGVRSDDDVRQLLDSGVQRVVVGTKAIEDWQWFEQVGHDPAFAGRLVLALDAKNGVVAIRGWTQASARKAVEVAAQVSDWPLGAILYTDVAKDGMLEGPNVDQTRMMAEAGKVPVIASGGVGNLDHIRSLCRLPIWGAIVGRSLYEGMLDLREAIRIARG